MNTKNYNNLLILGISIILLGLSLLTYCITSYSDLKSVTDSIDFDELDNNNRIPTADKYYKHLSIADTLNQKLNKNKNLPVKNMSCAYLDFSQHNIKSMYKLIFKGASEDESKRAVVEGNVEALLTMYDSYKNCRKTAEYKQELSGILEEIKNYENSYDQTRMDRFLSTKSEIQSVQADEQDPELIDARAINEAAEQNSVREIGAQQYPQASNIQQYQENMSDEHGSYQRQVNSYQPNHQY